MHNSSQERGKGICEGTSSANTKVGEEGGGRCATNSRAETPLQPVTVVRQLRQFVSHTDPGKKRDRRKEAWDLFLHIITLLWFFTNKSNSLSWVCFAQSASGHTLALPRSLRLLWWFLSLAQTGKGKTEHLSVTWHPTKVSLTQWKIVVYLPFKY